MTSVTHQPFEYFLDLDILSFNALLDVVVEHDACNWKNQAFIARLAAHAEDKQFKSALDAAWGKPKQEGETKGVDAFMKKFGGGI